MSDTQKNEQWLPPTGPQNFSPQIGDQAHDKIAHANQPGETWQEQPVRNFDNTDLLTAHSQGLIEIPDDPSRAHTKSERFRHFTGSRRGKAIIGSVLAVAVVGTGAGVASSMGGGKPKQYPNVSNSGVLVPGNASPTPENTPTSENARKYDALAVSFVDGNTQITSQNAGQVLETLLTNYLVKDEKNQMNGIRASYAQDPGAGEDGYSMSLGVDAYIKLIQDSQIRTQNHINNPDYPVQSYDVISATPSAAPQDGDTTITATVILHTNNAASDSSSLTYQKIQEQLTVTVGPTTVTNIEDGPNHVTKNLLVIKSQEIPYYSTSEDTPPAN